MKVKELISEIEHLFGRQPKKYIMRLMNDALTEIGSTRQFKKGNFTENLQKDQRLYNLDGNIIDITRVEIKDTNGRYNVIPKLTDPHLLLKGDNT